LWNITYTVGCHGAGSIPPKRYVVNTKVNKMERTKKLRKKRKRKY